MTDRPLASWLVRSSVMPYSLTSAVQFSIWDTASSMACRVFSTSREERLSLIMTLILYLP